MSSELTESTGVTNMERLLEKMIDNKADPAQLGKMMDLAERWAANQAAQGFADALTGFQAECPPVFKRRHANAGKMQFDFASYDDVMREAGPLLAKWKIVPTYTTEDVTSDDKSRNKVRCVCRIRVGRHVEETAVTVPIPAGTVNDTQLYGQALTYVKRYALCAALGIVVTDEDNDSSWQLDTIGAEEIGQLNRLIAEKHVDLARFLKYANVESLDRIPKKELPKLLDMLRRKKAVES